MDKKKIAILSFAGIFVFLIVLLIANGASTPSADIEDTSNLTEESIATEMDSSQSTDEGNAEGDNTESFAICKPAPLTDRPEIIIQKSAYIVSYNKDTKCPNWVAWHLTAEHTDGPFPRLSNFYEDEAVSPRATLSDYYGSGWSRGHMCPAGDNKWDKQAMYESFSLINICPQNTSLNSGLWNSIEIDCRNWSNKFGDIYIVCGPIFFNKEHETIGENKVVVPEAFFKVVLCLNGTPKGFGFIVRNTDGTKKRDLYYNSIDEVERITGYDFFPALPDDIEQAVEAVANIDDWRN